MTDHTDYETDYDSNLIVGRSERRSEEDWDKVWNVEDRNRDTHRKIELGLAVIAAGVTLVVLRGGWLRMTRPSHVVPSAAEIHVRLPPPR